MVNEPRWAVGSNQYRKRPGRPTTSATPGGPDSEPVVDLGPVAKAPRTADEHRAQLEDTGVCWDVLDYSPIVRGGTDRARKRFRASLPDLVWNTAALEGNTFTLPEVRTLLEGTTPAGKSTADAEQVLALSEAYNELDDLVANGSFRLSKDVSDRLHAIVARHEALDAGRFRGEGPTHGGGAVLLSTGGRVEGVPHGEGGVELRRRHDRLLEHLEHLADPRERALAYFASATRTQFYFDGNKRTARLMMSGALMASGHEVVNVAWARRAEYNHALDALFTTDDATELMAFLVTCTDAS